MRCPNCNSEIADTAKFCEYCGAHMDGVAQAQYQEPSYSQQSYSQQPYQQPYSQPVNPQPYAAGAAVPVGAKNKIAAGLLGIFLGEFGAHKFYLGYTRTAVIMLLVTIVGGIITFGLASAVMAIIGLVEGIMYLVKPDGEFYQTYEVGKKEWF